MARRTRLRRTGPHPTSPGALPRVRRAPSPSADAVASTDVPIELDIKVDFTFSGSGNFAVSDEFTFMGFGPGLVEADARYDNTNQFAETSDVLDGDANTGTGTVAVSENGDRALD